MLQVQELPGGAGLQVLLLDQLPHLLVLLVLLLDQLPHLLVLPVLLPCPRKGEFLLTDSGLQCNSCVRRRLEEEEGQEAGQESCKACQLPIHVKNLVRITL